MFPVYSCWRQSGRRGLVRVGIAVQCVALLALALPAQIAAAASFTSTASVNPSTVAPGGSVTITANFTSSTSISVNLDIEVRDGSNNKVFQDLIPGQAFSASQTRTYTTTCTTSAQAALGPYTVKLCALHTLYLTRVGWSY